MEKSIESVRRNFNTVRTGRANVSILDRIQARPLRTLRRWRATGGLPPTTSLHAGVLS